MTRQWGITEALYWEQNNPFGTFSHRVMSRMDQEDKVKGRKEFRH